MTKKKDYRKPELHKVGLAADEAVLNNCKSDVAIGPHLGGRCVDTAGVVCSQPGS